MNKEQFEELLFFSDNEEEFNEDTLDNLLSDESLILLLKMHGTAEVEDIDDLLLNLVYGDIKKPPGEAGCIYELLFDSIEDETNGEIKQLKGKMIYRNCI